jgi:hypothetical protein
MLEEYLWKAAPIPKMYSWSAARKAHSDFGINEVTSDGIIVRIGKRMPFVPTKEFLRSLFFPLWGITRPAKVQRHELRDICRKHITLLAFSIGWNCNRQ